MTLKSRVVIAWLQAEGFVFAGGKGDHQVYKRGSWQRVDVPTGGRRRELTNGCLQSIVRQLERAGYDRAVARAGLGLASDARPDTKS